MTTKTCSVCGQSKLLSEYTMKKKNSHGVTYASLGKPDQPYSRCKQCHTEQANAYRSNQPRNRRSAKLKHLYGLTIEGYERMLDEQHHTCAICNQPETATIKGKVKALQVDHCHTTGKVRGLLCSGCNNLIERAKENSDRLMSAVFYLREHGSCRSNPV